MIKSKEFHFQISVANLLKKEARCTDLYLFMSCVNDIIIIIILLLENVFMLGGSVLKCKKGLYNPEHINIIEHNKTHLTK
jgi:hypothetical protein